MAYGVIPFLGTGCHVQDVSFDLLMDLYQMLKSIYTL